MQLDLARALVSQGALVLAPVLALAFAFVRARHPTVGFRAAGDGRFTVPAVCRRRDEVGQL